MSMSIEDINKYINELYVDKSTKRKFIEETELKEFIPVVDEEVARLLKLLLILHKPKRILEIGTSIGYSATSMAKVIQKFGGTLTTIEYDEKVANQAQQNFEKAGVSEIINVVIGDAQIVIPNLKEDFDFIFLDVDKRLYPKLLSTCVNHLKQGGLLVAEDTLFPVIDLDPKWHHLIAPIEEYNHLVCTNRELHSTILPIGDGVTIAIKK